MSKNKLEVETTLIKLSQKQDGQILKYNIKIFIPDADDKSDIYFNQVLPRILKKFILKNECQIKLNSTKR